MKKLINFRPILFIMLSLCCGIATTCFFMFNKIIWGIFFIAVCVFSIIIFMSFYSKQGKAISNLIFSIIFLVFFIIGGLKLYCNLDNYISANLGGHNYDVKAKIVQCYQTQTGNKYILSNAEINGNRKGKIFYKISLSVEGESQFDIGDVITFNANLYDSSIIYEDRFNANDIERDVKYYASAKAEGVIKVSNDLTIFERINLFIRESLKSGLDNKEFAVGYALLTGSTNFMDNDLISSYRDAGVAHVFAVSGLHIGFLAIALLFIFNKIRIKPFIKTIIITLALLAYSGICGFSASSLRATIMTSVMLFAKLKGSRYDSLTALSFAGILILLFSPVQLFCVGFQLSFMVVLGVIVLSKPLAKMLRFLPRKVASSIGVVVSAQIFSVPICLYAFSKFSAISIIANLIFIPIVSAIFILTLVATILGGIFGISNVLLLPSNYIFKLINFLISAFDYKIFLIGGFTFGSSVIAYYLLWFVLGDMFNLKRLAKLITSLILVATCLFTMVLVNCSDKRKIVMNVTHCDTLSATYIHTEEQNLLIVSNAEYIYSTSSIKRVINKTNCNQLDTLVLMGGYKANLQEFITKMTSVYDIKRVYYYGHRQLEMEVICAQSFPKIMLKNFYDGELLLTKNLSLSFAMEGKVILGRIGSQKTAIFSRLGEEHLDFSCIDIGYDIMVCFDRAEAILSRYKPQKAISYKYSNIYQNAQSYGNICLKFN